MSNRFASLMPWLALPALSVTPVPVGGTTTQFCQNACVELENGTQSATSLGSKDKRSLMGKAREAHDKLAADKVHDALRKLEDYKTTLDSLAAAKKPKIGADLIHGPQRDPVVSGVVETDRGELLAGVLVTAFQDGEMVGQSITDGLGDFELTVPAGKQTSMMADPGLDGTANGETFLGFPTATASVFPQPGGHYHVDLVLHRQHLLSAPPGAEDFPVVLATPDNSVVIAGIPPDLGIVGGSARAFSPTFNPEAFPGRLETRQPGLESGLISGGFVSVNLLGMGDDGTPVRVEQLRDAEGSPVHVNLRWLLDRADWPVIQDPAHFQHLPSYVEREDRIGVPLYFFDETLGDWRLTTEFGWLEDQKGLIPQAALPSIQDGTYPDDIYVVGVVDHFSWYNLDYPTRDACLTGQLVNRDGEPVPFASVWFRSFSFFSSPFSGVLSAETDRDGPACGSLRGRSPRDVSDTVGPVVSHYADQPGRPIRRLSKWWDDTGTVQAGLRRL